MSIFAKIKSKITVAAVKLTAAVLVCIFAVIGGGAYVFGWFAVNDNTDANGIGLTAAGIAEFCQYDVFIYDFERNEGAGGAATTDEEGNKYTISDIKLNYYDKIFYTTNIYTPVIVRIKVDASKVALSGTFKVIVDRNTNADSTFPDDTTESATLTNYGSSVFRFVLAINPSYNDADENEIYSNVRDALYDGAIAASNRTGVVFTTRTNDMFKKAENVSATASYDASKKNGDYYYLYLFILYDVDLINYVTGDGEISLTNEILFANDMLKISVIQY